MWAVSFCCVANKEKISAKAALLSSDGQAWAWAKAVGSIQVWPVWCSIFWGQWAAQDLFLSWWWQKLKGIAHLFQPLPTSCLPESHWLKQVTWPCAKSRGWVYSSPVGGEKGVGIFWTMIDQILWWFWGIFYGYLILKKEANFMQVCILAWMKEDIRTTFR